jgi:transposase
MYTLTLAVARRRHNPTWYQLCQEDGIEGLASFGHEGGSCRLTMEQQDKLKAWIAATLPRSTRAVGAWIAAECGIEYQTRSGLIALLHRIGHCHGNRVWQVGPRRARLAA